MKDNRRFSSLLYFFSRETSLQERIHWIFRISLAFCFVGHGAFGIITKAEWLPYFALMSLGSEWAYRFMPLVGILDIAPDNSNIAHRPWRIRGIDAQTKSDSSFRFRGPSSG